MEASSAADAGAAWRSEMGAVLGQPAAAPAHLDRHFYDGEQHVARVLAAVAGFQLHAAACPQGVQECLPAGAPAAGKLLRWVLTPAVTRQTGTGDDGYGTALSGCDSSELCPVLCARAGVGRPSAVLTDISEHLTPTEPNNTNNAPLFPMHGGLTDASLRLPAG